MCLIAENSKKLLLSGYFGVIYWLPYLFGREDPKKIGIFHKFYWQNINCHYKLVGRSQIIETFHKSSTGTTLQLVEDPEKSEYLVNPLVFWPISAIFAQHFPNHQEILHILSAILTNLVI